MSNKLYKILTRVKRLLLQSKRAIIKDTHFSLEMDFFYLFYIYLVALVSLANNNLFDSVGILTISGVSSLCLIQLHCSSEFININSHPMCLQYAFSSLDKISFKGRDFSFPPINVVDGNLNTRSISASSVT